MENRKSEMIQVAICDKEPLILERLEELVKTEMKETGKPFNVEEIREARFKQI